MGHAPRRSELRALTGLRAVAAGWVIAFHYLSPGQLGTAPPLLVARGYLGVDLFFVLSGFILTQVYSALPGTGRAARGFYALRLGRIYPVHAVILAGLVAIELARGWGDAFSAPGRSLHTLAAHALLAHGFGLFETLSWNRVSWSISSEWLAYLLFPLAIAGVRRCGRTATIVLAAACACALFALEAHAGSLDLSGRLAPVRCLLEVAIGMLAARSWRMPAGVAAEVAPNLAMLGVFSSALLAGSDALAVVCMAALVASLAQQEQLAEQLAEQHRAELHTAPVRARPMLSRLLASQPLHALGTISYSLYLWHHLTHAAVTRALAAQGITSIWVCTTAALFVLLLAALASHRVIEAPCRAWVRERLRHRLRDAIAA